MLYQGANFSATEQMNWWGVDLQAMHTLRNRTSKAVPGGGEADLERTLRDRTTLGVVEVGLTSYAYAEEPYKQSCAGWGSDGPRAYAEESCYSRGWRHAARQGGVRIWWRGLGGLSRLTRHWVVGWILTAAMAALGYW